MAGGFTRPQGESWEPLIRQIAALSRRIRALEKPSAGTVSSLPGQVAAKTTVTWSLSVPIGAGSAVGDAWYRQDELQQIIGIWYWDGDDWVSQTITDDAVSNLSADKITAGTLDASLVAIRSASSGGRVEIDGEGFRGYDESGTLKTSVGTDGELVAQDASILGTIRTATTGTRIELRQSDQSLAFFFTDGTSNILKTSGSSSNGSFSMLGPFEASPTGTTPARAFLDMGTISVAGITVVTATLSSPSGLTLRSRSGNDPTKGQLVLDAPNIGVSGQLDLYNDSGTLTGTVTKKSQSGFGGIVQVGSTAERTAVFGATPTQGDRCFRTDLMWEETYFTAYDPSTNPGGTVAAGWYPTAGMLPRISRWRASTATQTIAQNTFVTALLSNADGPARGISYNVTTGAYTVNQAGMYDISAFLVFTGSGAETPANPQRRIAQIVASSMPGFAAQIIDFTPNSQDFRMNISYPFTFASGDTFILQGRSDSAAASTGLSGAVTAVYQGPA